MSVLSDRDIQSSRRGHEIVIRPFRPEKVQPASYDLVLHPNLMMLPRPHPYAGLGTVNIRSGRDHVSHLYEREAVSLNSYTLLFPGQSALALTWEVIGIDRNLIGRLEGRSSIGRLFLVVHATAGYIDPGWRGRITLELTNIAPYPIALFPGMPIAQISFERLHTPALRSYGDSALHSKYAHGVPDFFDDWPVVSQAHKRYSHEAPHYSGDARLNGFRVPRRRYHRKDPNPLALPRG